MFRSEHLRAFKVALERTRAEANEELVETLQSYEEEESARLDHLERQYQDPDDVFIAARNRKQEIKEQIRDLQRGLERQGGRRMGKKKRS